MTLYLRHTYGTNVGKQCSYAQSRIRVGRSPDNELRMDPERDEEVSGHHAVIYLDGDEFLIQDLNSTNGTFVNGRRISDVVTIHDGDEIEFAPGGPRVIFSTQATKELNPTTVIDRVANGPRATAVIDFNSMTASGHTPENMRIGARTAMFMRNIRDASSHTIKRLRFAMFCTALIFGFIAAGLVLSNRVQRQEISTLAQRADQIQAANSSLQSERQALQVVGEQLQQKVSAQEAELVRLDNLIKKLAADGLKPHITAAGNVAVNLPNVLFGYNDSTLTSEGLSAAHSIAAALGTENADRALLVEGHASRENGGNEQRNQELSLQRADAVAAALAANGILPQRVTTRGFGSSRPVASNDDEEGRRANRRVEVIFADAGSMPKSNTTLLQQESRPAGIAVKTLVKRHTAPVVTVPKAPSEPLNPTAPLNSARSRTPDSNEKGPADANSSAQVEQIKIPMKVDQILDSVFDK